MRHASLRIERVATATLDATTVDEMFALYGRSAQFPREQYIANLRATERVYLGRAHGGHLVATAALAHRRLELDDRAHTVIWTSLVTTDPAHRGHGLHARLGLDAWLRLRATQPRAQLYWGFLAASPRAYLLMARNCLEHWPRHDRSMPPTVRTIVDTLGSSFADYDRDSGTVLETGFRLREPIPTHTDRSPDLALYHTRLAGRGDPRSGLVCLCPLSARNFAHIVRRQWRKARSTRRRRPQARGRVAL